MPHSLEASWVAATLYVPSRGTITANALGFMLYQVVVCPSGPARRSSILQVDREESSRERVAGATIGLSSPRCFIGENADAHKCMGGEESTKSKGNRAHKDNVRSSKACDPQYYLRGHRREDCCSSIRDRESLKSDKQAGRAELSMFVPVSTD